MHRNENKYDQMFRNRLRDLTHPVRSELWSRIHSGISARKAPIPNPGTKLPFQQSAVRSGGIFSRGLFSATRIAVAAAAAMGITVGVIHFTHTATPPSAASVNRYPTLTPATKPVQSTGERSLVRQDSLRDRSSESAATGDPRTTLPPPGSNVASNGVSHASAVTHRHHRTPGGHVTPGDAATEAMPGTGTPDVEEPVATPGKQTIGKPAIRRRNEGSVILPAMASISSRAAITASSPGAKSLHNGSKIPGKKAGATHFERTGSLSLYASPAFPNHFYTWSYTLGGRLTFQFSRRLSFTAGFEYARVNVPTQYIPPVANNNLQAFHWSNYEVPILFGYTRNFRRATLTINGGVIANLYFHASTGAYIDNLPDPDTYGAVLGVDYSYPLGRHLAAFAEPYARYSISDNRSFTQTERWSFGTLLGIKYRL